MREGGKDALGHDSTFLWSRALNPSPPPPYLKPNWSSKVKRSRKSQRACLSWMATILDFMPFFGFRDVIDSIEGSILLRSLTTLCLLASAGINFGQNVGSDLDPNCLTTKYFK